MTPAEQRHHAIGVLSRIWTLWMALTEPERLTHKEATMAKPWLCRIGRHRWQRLRNPEGGWYRECREVRKATERSRKSTVHGGARVGPEADGRATTTSR